MEQELVYQETERNQFKNPFKNWIIFGIYLTVLSAVLRLTPQNMALNFKYFAPAMDKYFGEFLETAEPIVIYAATVTAFVSVVFLAFSVLLYFVFKTYYAYKKPYSSEDIEQTEYLLSTAYGEPFYKAVLEALKLEAYLAVKSAFCTTFKAEILNFALTDLIEKDIYISAFTFKNYGEYITRENYVLFNKTLAENEEKVDLDEVFALNNKSKIPFVLEPVATAVSNKHDLFYNGEIKKKDERKYDLVIKIVSFLFLSLSVVCAEIFAVAAVYSYSVFRLLFESEFWAVLITAGISLPIVIIMYMFLSVVLRNKNSGYETAVILTEQITESEIEIADLPVRSREQTEFSPTVRRKSAQDFTKILASLWSAAVPTAVVIFKAVKRFAVKVAAVSVTVFAFVKKWIKESKKSNAGWMAEFIAEQKQKWQKDKQNRELRETIRKKDKALRSAEREIEKQKQAELREKQRLEAQKQRDLQEAQKREQEQQRLLEKERMEKAREELLLKQKADAEQRKGEIAAEQAQKAKQKAEILQQQKALEAEKQAKRKAEAEQKARRSKELYEQRLAEQKARKEKENNAKTERQRKKQLQKQEQQKAIARQVAQNRRILMEQRAARERAEARRRAMMQNRKNDGDK